MTVPEKTAYRDVHGATSIPRVKLSTVETYLHHFDTTLLPKVKEFYTDRFISYVRHAIEGELTYIHAKCFAEYKKGVSYFIDVSLDKNGIMKECQCDCPAGEGPDAHCKHIMTVLWALVSLSNSGSIITEETCTQRLQTFHKVKKLTGSPAKVHTLDMGTDGDFDFDPRPTEYVNNKGYPDFVKNMIINFQPSHRTRHD
jgi:hypothetical protein